MKKCPMIFLSVMLLFCGLKLSALQPSVPTVVFVEGKNSEMDDFYIMKYNVTVKEYKLFLSKTDRKLDFDENRNYEKSINECIEDENSAITNLTLQEIIAFAEWLNKEQGLDSMYDIEADGTIRQKSAGNGYRLPSSEEWEWAKSGGKKARGFEYPGSDNLPEVAWCAQNSKGKIHQPGLKKSNELGIYDMLGNVDEFCSDEYVMFPPNIDIKKIPCAEWSDAFHDFYKSVYNTFSSEPVKWQYVRKRDLYGMNIPSDESYVKKFTRFLKKSKNIDSMRLEDVYVDPDTESIFTELQYNGIRLVRTASVLFSRKNAVLNASRVRLRTEPNLECETVQFLENGQKADVIGISSQKQKIDGEIHSWYKVRLKNGTTGWIYGKYLDGK